jgi:hypothetical protein
MPNENANDVGVTDSFFDIDKVHDIHSLTIELIVNSTGIIGSEKPFDVAIKFRVKNTNFSRVQIITIQPWNQEDLTYSSVLYYNSLPTENTVDDPASLSADGKNSFSIVDGIYNGDNPSLIFNTLINDFTYYNFQIIDFFSDY